MSRCTWKECASDATQPQRGNDGSVWADLCEPHHVELDAAVGSMNVKKLMRAYVLAQGGAAAAARRMVGGNDE